MLLFLSLLLFLLIIRISVLSTGRYYDFCLGVLEDTMVSSVVCVFAYVLYFSPLFALFLTFVEMIFWIDALLMYRLHLRFFRRFIVEFYKPLYWKKVPIKELLLFSLPLVGMGALNVYLVQYPPIQLRTLLLTFALILILYLVVRSACGALYHKDWANLFFLWFQPKENERPKTYRELAHFIDPNEDYSLPSSEYPLLRNTKGYRGEKQWETQIKSSERPSVCVILLESLRAKDVGHLGGSYSATPELDKLSDQSIAFSRFYANGPLSLHGLFSVLYGIPPCYAPFHVGSLDVYDLPVRGLYELFTDRNYTVAHIQNSDPSPGCLTPFLRQHNLKNLIDESQIIEYCEANNIEWKGDDRTLWEFVSHWQKEQTSPTFTTILTSNSHYPFSTPISYEGPDFADVPCPLYRNYLRSIHYTDQELGRFMEKAPKDTIYLILGDHGYHLNEHGLYHNTMGLYEESIHVPCLLYAPQYIKGPKKLGDVSSQNDILPTLIDMLDIQTEHHSIGRSLMRTPKECSALCMNPFQEHCYAEITGNKKVYVFQDKATVYDIVKDPFEENPNEHRGELVGAIQDKYRTLHTLFRCRQFAPDHLEHLCIRSEPYPSDDQVIKEIEKKPNITSIDLSDCHTLSAKTLMNLPNSLETVNLSNTLFTKKDLEDFFCQQSNITSLNISYCSLLSGLPNNCSVFLKHLNISGLGRCGHEDLHLVPPQIRSLHLSGWDLQPEGAACLAKKMSAIRTLHVDSVQKEHALLYEQCRGLRELVIQGSIDPNILNTLKANHLKRLVIQDGSNLSKELLHALHRFPLRSLHIGNAHELTNSVLNSLLTIPLETLILCQIPTINQDCLEHLKKHRLSLIVFSECPQIPLMDEVRYIPITDKITQVQRIQSFPCPIATPYF